MGITIIGAEGSMGRRYSAIVKYLGHKFRAIELDDQIPEKCDRVIIATPTVTHHHIVTECIRSGANHILVEKPLFQDLNEYDFKPEFPCDIRMVCNYAFIDATYSVFEPPTYYDNYYAGKEEPWSNFIQLAGLARGSLVVKEDSPLWKCCLNGKELTLQDVHRSYIMMVEAWLKDPSRLVGVDVAKKWHKKALKWQTEYQSASASKPASVLADSKTRFLQSSGTD